MTLSSVRRAVVARQKKKKKKKKGQELGFLGKTSVVVALGVSVASTIFTGIGVFLDHEGKNAPKPAQEVVQPTYSCPEERMEALEFRNAYPQISRKYTGAIQDQCQLNEVVADAAAIPPPPPAAGG